MSRIRLGLFGCVCAVVMLAVGASTAFATFTKTTTKCLGEGVANVCLAEASEGELFEATGTETFTSTVGASTFLVASLGLVLHGTGGSASGTINQATALSTAYTISKLKIDFTGVTISSESSKEIFENCTTPTLNETLPLKGTAVQSGGAAELEGEEGEKPKFTTLEITSIAGKTCPATVVGNTAVSGKQIILYTTPGVDLVKQAFKTEETEEESKLKFGANAASFAGSGEIELTSKKPFDSVLA